MIDTANPKDKVGSLKYPMHFVSRLVMGWVGVAMLEGALKYGGHNYRVAGVKASVNTTAIQHHLDAFHEGQDIDPDSNIHHLAKLIAAATVLYDGILQRNWIDDRPPRNPAFQEHVDCMNAATKALIAKYPAPVEPFTQAGVEDDASREFVAGITQHRGSRDPARHALCGPRKDNPKGLVSNDRSGIERRVGSPAANDRVLLARVYIRRECDRM